MHTGMAWGPDMHLPTDGYGVPLLPFELPSPALPDGWSITKAFRLADGEHVVHVLDPEGVSWRWLEDEGGLEWAYRTRHLAD